jgi:predicted RNase H-like HicB family nuclease
MKRRYSVVLTPEPDGSAINVTSPDIPDLVTFGRSREEALAMARDCAEGLILSYLDHGDELPEEGGRAEVATIEVDLDALRARLAAEKVAANA